MKDIKIFLKKKRQKAKKTNGEKRFEIDMKIFLKKKKKKRQNHCERNKNFSNEQKQKQVEYMRNCYLTHQK